MIEIKSQREIALMRIAGEIVAKTHELLKPMIQNGVSTMDLELAAEKFILENGATPSFKNYNGFPYALCISMNNEVVHGMPSHDKILRDGDIVSIDIGACYKGYHGDSAWTYAVGNVSDEAKYLMEHTKNALFVGLEECVAGKRIGDISNAIEKYARKHNLGITKELSGHGIGKKLHEDPEVPNYGAANKGAKLKVGMTIAIEPMLNLGEDSIRILDDEWTIVTKDGSLAAHYEHTIVILEEGYEILTKDNGGTNG